MKRFIASATLFVCTLLMSGSITQLIAQDPTAVGGGGQDLVQAATKTKVDAAQILNCWMKSNVPVGPNTPDYNLEWDPSKENPHLSTCPRKGNNCRKICGIISEGTVETTDYGYKLTVTLNGTEYTRSNGEKQSGDTPHAGTIIGKGECIVRIDHCPGAPELESLQFDFEGLAVSEAGTVSMIIPYL